MSKTLARKVSIYIDDKEVKSTLKSLQTELSKLEAKQKKMTIGSEEYIQTTKKIAEIKGVINEQRRAVNDMSRAWELSTQRASDYSNILMGTQSAVQMATKAYGWVEGFVEQAAAMDDAMADVMKTTGMTHGEVERLNEGLRQMDTRTSREELLTEAAENGSALVDFHTTAAVEVHSPAVVAALDLGVVERGAGENGTADNRIFKTGVCQVGTREVGARKVGTCQVGARKVGARKVGTRKVGIRKVGTAKTGAPQVTPRQLAGHQGKGINAA